MKKKLPGKNAKLNCVTNLIKKKCKSYGLKNNKKRFFYTQNVMCNNENNVKDCYAAS